MAATGEEEGSGFVATAEGGARLRVRRGEQRRREVHGGAEGGATVMVEERGEEGGARMQPNTEA